MASQESSNKDKTHKQSPAASSSSQSESNEPETFATQTDHRAASSGSPEELPDAGTEKEAFQSTPSEQSKDQEKIFSKSEPGKKNIPPPSNSPPNNATNPGTESHRVQSLRGVIEMLRYHVARHEAIIDWRRMLINIEKDMARSDQLREQGLETDEMREGGLCFWRERKVWLVICVIGFYERILGRGLMV